MMSDDLAAAFGLMVRTNRRAMKMKQDELALVSGVGVRFIHDLEAGKPSCQLGKALAVGRVLGISIVDSKGAEAQGTTL
jgi:DNA-binding XRE family transcriptional regulator